MTGARSQSAPRQEALPHGAALAQLRTVGVGERSRARTGGVMTGVVATPVSRPTDHDSLMAASSAVPLSALLLPAPFPLRYIMILLHDNKVPINYKSELNSSSVPETSIEIIAITNDI